MKQFKQIPELEYSELYHDSLLHFKNLYEMQCSIFKMYDREIRHPLQSFYKE